jgi:hypothetical protein
MTQGQIKLSMEETKERKDKSRRAGQNEPVVGPRMD